MKTLIVIPARYGSTRLPGKPLAKISGKTMLSRVVSAARTAVKEKQNIELVVATDDARITAHCDDIGVASIMTPVNCATGTDRALAAVNQAYQDVDFIINLQGDAPLTPPDFIVSLLDEVQRDASVQMVTPVTQLSWDDLDKLRANKQTTPFSGTSAILDKKNNAIWFSKNIIPAIRAEEKHRQTSSFSPVFRHIGLYGYSRELLEQYVSWQQGYYEELEGLEQLRVLENGYSIRCVKVEYRGLPSMSGVDSPEDIERAEALITKYGDPLDVLRENK